MISAPQLPGEKTSSSFSDSEVAFSALDPIILVVGGFGVEERGGSPAGARLLELAERFEARAREFEHGFILGFHRTVSALECALCLSEKGFRVGGCLQNGTPGHGQDVALVLMRICSFRQILFSSDLAESLRFGAQTGSRSAGVISWRYHGAYLAEGVAQSLEIFQVGIPGRARWKRLDGKMLKVKTLRGPAMLGWRPAVGDRLPVRSDWSLLRHLGSEESTEDWLAMSSQSFEKRKFKLILDRDLLSVLQRRSYWLGQLKNVLYGCRRHVRVLDFELEGKTPFIALSRTSARPLRDQDELLALPLIRKLDLLAQVADALAVAHRHGVVHGCLSARNVLVRLKSTGALRVLLTDFAFPRPKYDPWESHYQALNRADDSVDVDFDYYAFGILFYKVLCADLSKPLPVDWRSDIRHPLLVDLIEAMLDGSSRKYSLLDLSETLRDSSWAE